MLLWKDFSAWLCIEGKEAPEYDVEVSEDERTVTCWIASELGKKFSVHWTNSSFYQCTTGRVKMDGTDCGGKTISGRILPQTVCKDGLTDGATLKPFMFSSLSLTDDDAYLGGAFLPDLGVIKLVITPTQVSSNQTRHSGRGSDLSTLKVHERSKKAVTQQITLAQAKMLATPITFVTTTPTGPAVVTFLFKYRPIDILRANGIAPPCAPVQSSPPPAKRVAKENKPLVNQETKPARVKRELATDSESDVIDLTQGSPGPRRKRVKLEGFVQGEIIDLT
ncbi:hypothetical protein DFH08DRAFT_49488 [Mycena albidolilacea]|uniref:DUF7918 domain-containing protein n=1 Tax=Mycena albidolilacea TaxID=1033008 RepID=A0AAD7AD61_9AGAR|nr:hypothetical protein DFH08DRAFT_49488 [Mycena albidolilacea]